MSIGAAPNIAGGLTVCSPGGCGTNLQLGQDAFAARFGAAAASPCPCTGTPPCCPEGCILNCCNGGWVCCHQFDYSCLACDNMTLGPCTCNSCGGGNGGGGGLPILVGPVGRFALGSNDAGGSGNDPCGCASPPCPPPPPTGPYSIRVVMRDNYGASIESPPIVCTETGVTLASQCDGVFFYFAEAGTYYFYTPGGQGQECFGGPYSGYYYAATGPVSGSTSGGMTPEILVNL